MHQFINFSYNVWSINTHAVTQKHDFKKEGEENVLGEKVCLEIHEIK
jgi:hypothetical protein